MPGPGGKRAAKDGEPITTYLNAGWIPGAVAPVKLKSHHAGKHPAETDLKPQQRRRLGLGRVLVYFPESKLPLTRKRKAARSTSEEAIP